jgi:biopolymer transport protein ExbD
MQLLDWIIVVAFLVALALSAWSMRRHANTVSGFLSANRLAGRYLLTVSYNMAQVGVITLVWYFQVGYDVGFTQYWWGYMEGPPKASEVQKLEKKSLVSFIYIGKPIKASLGTESRIQLNDSYATVGSIQAFVVAERQSRNEFDRKVLTTSLKVDAETKMGIVTDVKQELRKAGAYKINYSTHKRDAFTTR